ncbi:sugar ABC transporter permease [Candidatus Bipolaricaulota bacterium]|nr:sugar ABC transporter permease [Candidatus Bipolaricaulota bacterium]
MPKLEKFAFWKRPMPDEWRSRTFWKDTGWAYIYLLPALIILGIFTFYPFFSTFRLSLYRVSFTNFPGTYVGLDHFRYIFGDRYFWRALWNTLIIVGTSVPITLLLALVVANLLNKSLRFRTFARTSFFLSYITPMVAVIMVWQLMYNESFGLINYLIGLIGVDRIAWLNSPQYALPAVIILSIWRYVGYQAIILLAGMQGIDQMYYEAAKIDGASGFQVWRKITVPLLTPQIFFLLIISMIGSFKMFTEVYVLFTGTSGPLKSAETLVYYIMRQGFFFTPHYGRAAAASIVLFAIIFIVTLFQMQVAKKRVHYQ